MTPGGRRVSVRPASAAPYEVRVGAGVAPAFADELAAMLGGGPGRMLAVVDTGLPGGWLDGVLDAYRGAGFEVGIHRVDASEKGKSLAAFGAILERLAALGLERRDPVLAIGGGVIGDIAGFAASAYRRGVPVIQCPTTLLAMVDASTGGKTGVNVALPSGELLKNMAGSFHQPRAVLADIDSLRSLDDRQFRAGLGECIKHGMVAADWDEPGLLGWTRAHVDAVLTRDHATLVELVARNVAVKARVVEADEREQSDTGGRALLNLGHTFAHAIETIDGLHPPGLPPPLLHGEAVALGLVGAAACAEAMGRVDGRVVDGCREALAASGLPTSIDGLPDDQTLIARMRHDKKASGGKLRLTLPSGPGRAELVTAPPETAVAAGWAAIRADS